MRLIAAELRKVWTRRVFLLSLAALLLLNLFLLWNAARPSATALPAAAYRKMERDLQGLSMQEKGVFIGDAVQKTNAMGHIESILTSEAYGVNDYTTGLREQYASDFEQYGDLYASGGHLTYTGTMGLEHRFLMQIEYGYNEVNGYQDFLQEIVSNSGKLADISIFADTESGVYDLRNIQKTAAAYEGMQDIVTSYSTDKGLVTATSFALTDLVLLFAMLLIASALVRHERDAGLLALVRAAPAGRGKTAVAKLTALGISLLVVLAALYGGNLLFCMLEYGLGDLGRSIQSVPSLMRSTLRLNVGQYLGVFLLTKWAAALVAGAWVMLAVLAAKHAFAGWCAALALPALSYLVRSVIPAASKLNVLKYANLVSMTTTSEILGGYRNLYWFGYPMALPLVEGITALFLALLCMGGFYLCFTRAQLLPGGQEAFGVAGVAAHIPFMAKRRKKSKRTTLLRQEAYKWLFVNGAAFLLVGLLAFQVVRVYQTETTSSPDEIYLRRYMQKLEGPITQEKLDWLEAQKAKFRPVFLLQQKRDSGEMSENEYYFAMSPYFNLEYEIRIFGQVVTKLNALREKPGAQFVYDTGYPALLGITGEGDSQELLLTGLFCALCFSGLFAMEKSSGMERVVGATPLGRSATAGRKLLLGGVGATVLTALALLPRIAQIWKNHGLSAPLAPLYSLPDYPNAPRAFSILALLCFALLARLTATFAMVAVTLVLSHKTGNTLAALFCSTGLFCLPALLALAGLPAARWISPYPLFHFGWMATTTPTAIAACFLLGIWAAVGVGCAVYLKNRFGRVG